MRVLFVYKYLTYGGGCETVLRARLDRLPALGVDAEAWFLYDCGGRELFAGLGDRVRIGSVDELSAYCAATRPDFISTLDTEEVFPLYRAGQVDAGLIVEVHTSYSESQTYLRALEGLPIRGFLAPSEFQCEVVRRISGTSLPVFVAPNPVRDVFLSEPVDFDPPPQVPLVAWIGRLDDLKNWQEFIAIAGQVRQSIQDVSFWLVGRFVDRTGDEKLRALARHAGALPGLRWFRGVSHGAVARVLDAVRTSGGVYVSTSTGESFGMTVAEAMARGCPVVVPASGPFLEYVEDGKNGWFYPLGSVKKAARTVATLLGDPERRRTSGRAARTTILARYAPEPAVAVLVELLGRLQA
ncbi:MAG: glycosyltransferase family 4 protein [Thermoanaerobaculaceae bacterium]|jgi:glycosyltransferase involved in cell wall biosynthesis|nr:glycosyltransferase family 4 protein [Thermoanaerobaculaceae bacterium]